MRPLSVHQVARELENRLPGLGVTKKHKLLYYCLGYHLAAFGEPLFLESLSAFDRGPLVRQLWSDEREGVRPPVVGDLDRRQLNTVGYVVSRFGALTGKDLGTLTHQEPPWLDADARRRAGRSDQIDREALTSYFRIGDLDDEDGRPATTSGEVRRWLQTAARPLVGPGRVDTISELRQRLLSR